MLEPKQSVKDAQCYATDLFYEEWALKLDGNENNIGPSQGVIQALRNIDAKDIKFYPVYGELINKIAQMYNISPKCVLLTNGADEALSVIYQTYINPGDEVISISPTFVMPKKYVELCAGVFREIPYREKWKFCVSDLLNAQSIKTKFFNLTTPNNPTGDVLSKDEIISFLKTGKGVVLDETYANYSNQTNFDLIREYDNLFVVKSFSKDFALAGLRLGYILSAEQNIEQLKKVISPYSVNSAAVIAGIASLEDVVHLEYIKKEISESKELLAKGLEKLGALVYKGFGNFLLVDFKEKSEFIYKKLLKNKIKIKQYKNTPLLENCFRISIPDKRGTELILQVLNPRPFFAFDMDGVLVDVSKSYRTAIEKTYEYFANKTLNEGRIEDAKALGGLNCDWDLTHFLLKTDGFNVELSQIIDVFQNIYWDNGSGLINKEKLFIAKETLEELSQNADMAIFTGRPLAEALYTLKLFNIEDYFYTVVAKENLPSDRQKPDPLGLQTIKSKVLFSEMFYAGDTIDDIKCAKGANVNAIGVTNGKSNLIERLKNQGAMLVLDDINKIVELSHAHLDNSQKNKRN